MQEGYNIAVVGVGAVGEELLKVLSKSTLPIKDLKVLARTSRPIEVEGKIYTVRETKPDEFDGVDIALFAGTERASELFAKEAVKRGVIVIDNSATFRLEPDVPLVVPEVNPEDLEWHKGLIANPNCSTIQMVVALKPLYDRSRIRRIFAATYQAVSGTGRDAITELRQQSILQLVYHEEVKMTYAYPYRIAFNLIPQIGSFDERGYTTEEMKMVNETHKIFHDPEIKITATCVRVPVFNCHSEAVYIETEEKITAEEARELLRNSPGIKVIDEPSPHSGRSYPMPIDADGRDEVFVGRIREDPFVETGLHLWIVADNLRKGAALNAVQIAEELHKRGLIKK
ncbi:aspartate-semialdehyde dehydrogenase [bacterium]|nr:aspartate-semialdehyde dehydrogenase [bacterium]